MLLVLLFSTTVLLLTVDCLQPEKPLTARVISGHEALLRPHMAYVQIGTSGSCGGFLIREDVVLTAAHCNCNLGQMFVYLGVKDFMVPGENWQRIQVRRWVQHPNFNNENYDNDIMLLKMTHGADLNEWVGTIPLPEANDHLRPGAKCSVAGWGRIGVNMNTDRLQEAEQEVVSGDLCQKRYRHYNPTTMLCAGNSQTNESAYQGDSGGPLVCNGMVRGIVSNGDLNGHPPSIYTRISHFIPWINEMLQKLS